MTRDTICSGVKLTAIAAAIRTKGGGASSMTLDAMAQAIADLPSGGGDIDAMLDGSITEIISNATTLRTNALTYLSNLRKCYIDNMTAVSSVPSNAGAGVGARFSAMANSFPNAQHMGGRFEWQRWGWMHGGYGGLSGISVLKYLCLPRITATSYQSLTYYIAYNCASLTNVYMPLCATLERFASGCSALEALYLPACTTVGANALTYCAAFTALVLPGNTVATLAAAPASAFSNTPIASGTGYVYVPSALLSAYQAATNWSTIAGQFRAIEDYPTEVAAAKALYDETNTGW